MTDLTLDQIKSMLREMDPGQDEDEETFKAGVVLIASVQQGPNIKNLSRFTAYPYSLVAKFGSNLRRSGIWCGRHVRADWFGKDGVCNFILDTCIAVGWLERTEAAGGKR